MKLLTVSVVFFLGFSTVDLFSSENILTERSLFKLIVDWGYLENFHPDLLSNKYNSDSLFCELTNDIICNRTIYSSENLFILLNTKLPSPFDPNCTLYLKMRNDYTRRKRILSCPLTDSSIINNRIIYNDSSDQYVFLTSVKIIQPFPSSSQRLLGLSKIWNNYKFYYPYQEILPRNRKYEDLLKKYIRIILNCHNYSEYHLAITRLTSEYRDTHSKSLSFVINNHFGKRTIPAKVRFVNHKVVVQDSYDKALLDSIGLKIGDIIVKINGETITKIFQRLKPFIASSNSASFYRDLCNLSLFTNQDSMRLMIKRGRTSFSLNLSTFKNQDLINREQYITNSTSLITYNDSILYIKCKNVDSTDLRDILTKNHQLKWFIFDLRSSTKWIKPIIEDFFFQDKTVFAAYYKPLLSSPGFFSDLNPLTVGPGKPYIQLTHPKVIALVNENTQSQGEFQTMVLQSIPKAITIGSMTAGTDGNTSEFLIPGNITVRMTLIGIQYPDGKKTQRHGVKIDYHSSPDIKSTRLEIDQELNLALKMIKKGG